MIPRIANSTTALPHRTCHRLRHRRLGRSAWLVLLLISPLSLAGPSAGSIEIRKSAIVSGGHIASAGSLHLTGSIGQPLVEISSQGALRIHSGFWPDTETSDDLFSDGFES